MERIEFSDLKEPVSFNKGARAFPDAPVKTPSIMESPISPEITSTPSVLEAARRTEFLRVQALLSTVLAYQLLFSQDSLASPEVREGLVLTLILSLVALVLLPPSLWRAPWFVPGLVLADTLLTSVGIYLSGNADSDTYLAYFLVIVMAASVPSFTHLMGLALLMCGGYGVVVYVHTLETGVVSEGYLLRIPFLLTMAIFYGATAEMARAERREKLGLVDTVSALQQVRKEREGLIAQLQDALAKVKTLRGLLPICAACKRIRDDKGYWTHVEEYLRDRTEAEFSHAVCPNCATNLYGDSL